MITPESAKTACSSFLQMLRDHLHAQGLRLTRLPVWVEAARVSIGWTQHTVLMLFEDHIDGDDFRVVGDIQADTAVFFEQPEIMATGASFHIPLGRIPVCPIETTPDGLYPAELNLVGEAPALFAVPETPHVPVVLLNVCLHHNPHNTGIVATRFVPAAIYIHETDLESEETWGHCTKAALNWLARLHASAAADAFEIQRRPVEALLQTKQTSVIVLGKDTDESLGELIQCREALRKLGYEARLIKDLPEIPTMSNEEKVKLWSQASRFCVMLDREPAGHIAEYVFLKHQRTVLALLRPRSSGSTYMIGDDDLVDVRYIRRFEFDTVPQAVIADAVEWAESVVKEREIAYSASYPWR